MIKAICFRWLWGVLCLCGMVGYAHAVCEQPEWIEDNWTANEKWAWQQIKADKKADLRLFTENDERKPISAQFIKTIATNVECVQALPRPKIFIEGAKIPQKLDLSYLTINLALYIENSTLERGINTRDTRFNYLFSLNETYVKELLGVNRGISLAADRMTVRGSLFLNDSVFDADVRLGSVDIKGSVQLQNSTFKGTVDLTYANLGTELRLTYEDLSHDTEGAPSNLGTELISPYEDARKVYNAQWGNQAELLLANARVQALNANQLVWTRGGGWQRQVGGWTWVVETPLPLDLAGFEYTRFGGWRADQQENPMANADADWLISWLQQQRDAKEHYIPQPYIQLAKVIRNTGGAGAERKAKAIEYEQFRYRDRIEKPTGLTWGWRQLLRWVVGYGVYPEWAAGWLFGLWFLGVCVSYFSKGLYEKRSRTQVISEYPALCTTSDLHKKHWTIQFMYSLDATIPVIALYPRSAKIEHDNKWVDFWFGWQRLLGFTASTILVGALTGLLGG